LDVKAGYSPIENLNLLGHKEDSQDTKAAFYKEAWIQVYPPVLLSA